MSEFLPKNLVAGYMPFVAVSLALEAGFAETEEAKKFLPCLRAIEDIDPAKLRRTVSNGSDPNLQFGSDYKSLFRFAAERARSVECLWTLIEAGASRSDARTLVALARRGWHEIIVKL